MVFSLLIQLVVDCEIFVHPACKERASSLKTCEKPGKHPHDPTHVITLHIHRPRSPVFSSICFSFSGGRPVPRQLPATTSKVRAYTFFYFVLSHSCVCACYGYGWPAASASVRARAADDCSRLAWLIPPVYASSLSRPIVLGTNRILYHLDIRLDLLRKGIGLKLRLFDYCEDYYSTE